MDNFDKPGPSNAHKVAERRESRESQDSDVDNNLRLTLQAELHVEFKRYLDANSNGMPRELIDQGDNYK